MLREKKETKAPSAEDPLYAIFEQHLYHFPNVDEDRQVFIAKVVQDYLGFIRRQGIVVPKWIEKDAIEELTQMVETMLTKKIYGTFDLQSFREQLVWPDKVRRRRKSSATYKRLIKKAG